MNAIRPARAWQSEDANRDEPTLPGCCSDRACVESAGRWPWLRLIVGLFVAGQTMVLGLAINVTPPGDAATRLVLQAAMLAATLIVLAMLGLPLLRQAAATLRRGRITMELLFVTSLGAALAFSVASMFRGRGDVYFEVISIVLIIYTVGRAIGTVSRDRALASIRGYAATLAMARRGGVPVPVEQVTIGDLVDVAPGELIPVDGRIVNGRALVRETEYTGATEPTLREPGDDVRSGTLSLDGALVVAATAPGTARQIDQLLARIDDACRGTTGLQRQADHFVRWFLPLVVVTAVGALLYHAWRHNPDAGLMAAMAVLLVACPCAAGLATPLVTWSVLDRLARRGLVLRGGEVIERLATVDSVIFDKTGTLGSPCLTLDRFDIIATDQPVAAIVAAIERRCHHPVAAALRCVADDSDAERVGVDWVRILPGLGVASEVSLAGCRHAVRIVRDGAAMIQVSIDDRPAASAVLRERLRDDAADAVRQLTSLGLAVQVMTGDATPGEAAALAATDSAMSPLAKLDAVRLLRDEDRRFGRPLFVGDGLNDAAAMAAAHVGVAMAEGSAVTVEAAHATLHGGELSRLPQAIALSRSAVALIRSHLHWAAGYNLVGVAVAAAGMLHPVFAALLMAVSSGLVSLRSLRLVARLDAPSVAITSLPEPPLHARATRHAFAAVHLLSLAGQGWILARILGLGAIETTLTVAAMACLAGWALLLWQAMPRWADMTFAMLTVGGLGMTLGWWADLGFAAAPAPLACCAAALGEGPIHLLSWMNAGMLVLGVPAMFLMLRRREPIDLRRWCCVSMLVLGVPGMVLGMIGGSILAQVLAAGWPNHLALLLDYALMMIGMALGMLVPHAFHEPDAAWMAGEGASQAKSIKAR